MKPPRFIPTADGLILETPIPLSPMQVAAVASWAEQEYRRRLKGLTGDRRAALVRVIEDVRARRFVERPIPAHDCDREVILI
jgi:hypothetical protein